jgi:hypothetical protein
MKQLVVAILAFVAFFTANAGHPAKWCPIEGHKGPECEMKACARFNPDGTVASARCSMYCAKACCHCGEKCQEQGPSPDEESNH